MKKILLILLTLSIPVLLLADEPVREWKNKSGKTIIEASLDNTKANDDPEQVYFLKDGERFKYPFEKLSAADQDYVTKTRQSRRGLDGGVKRNEEARGPQVIPKNRRFALLIGVNAYPKEERTLKTLHSAVKDMTDLADALEKYAGFPRENITLMTDNSSRELLPTCENIKEQISIIRNKLSQNDLLIVAFSGHGVSIDLSNGKEARPYFCVRDTDLPDVDTLISRDWIFEQIDKCKADRKIFFCDACRVLYTRDDLVQLASRSGQSASIRSLQDPSETWGYNYVLMSSCSKGQISIDTGTNGLFTSFLLEGLRTSKAALQDGDLTVFSWFDYASKRTKTASERMIRENPALVIGVEKQTQQTPRIECRGEMTSLVIAKLDRASLEVDVPQNVEDVIVQEYQVGELNIKFQSLGSMLSGEKIKAGKIQLPLIPDKINELTGEVRGIQDALTRMENGTHEAIREAERVKTASQAQYEAIKMRRDEEWKQLPLETRNELERQIKESPTAIPTTFDELQPKGVSYSLFIKLVLWGQKTEQARLELLRVESDIKVAIQKEIDRIKTALAERIREYQTEAEKFRQSVVQFLLEKTPGWNKPNEDEKMDYLFLSETIPALLKYPFGWDEKKLFSLAEALWKQRRPCVLERIKEEKRRERERVAREEAERKESLKRLSVPGTKAGERIAVNFNGVEFAFRWAPSGTFMMGSPRSEDGLRDNETQHQVTLTKGFWMMETEVTNNQWKAIMGTNPRYFKGDDLPVGGVSWNDCQEFCKKCTQLGLRVQLPTEAQWEYACRAGTTGPYAGTLDEMAWYEDNSGNNAHPVGTKKPNAWGLYDMHGNVSEWCQDKSEDKYGGNDYPRGSATDPTGPLKGDERIVRGGYWNSEAKACRSASRWSNKPDENYVMYGFRCIKIP